MTFRKPDDVDDPADTSTVESPTESGSGPVTVMLDGEEVPVGKAVQRLQDSLTRAQNRIAYLEQVNAELREAVEYLGELHDKEIEIEA